MLVWENKKNEEDIKRRLFFQEQQAETFITLLKEVWCTANKVQNTMLNSLRCSNTDVAMENLRSSLLTLI